MYEPRNVPSGKMVWTDDLDKSKDADDPAVCPDLPNLVSSGDGTIAVAASTEGASSSPTALVAAWPHGGATGLLLDAVASFLVVSGVPALIGVRRRRRSLRST